MPELDNRGLEVSPLEGDPEPVTDENSELLSAYNPSLDKFKRNP